MSLNRELEEHKLALIICLLFIHFDFHYCSSILYGIKICHMSYLSRKLLTVCRICHREEKVCIIKSYYLCILANGAERLTWTKRNI